MYMLCLNLGTTVAPLIGVALAQISYNLLFWAEALAVLAFGLIALTALPRRAKPAEPAGGAAADKPRGSYLALLSDRRYVIFLGALLLQAVVYCQYTAALPLAITRAGMTIWWYGAIITINAIICATCQVLATKFVQAWPVRLVQFTGFSLVALGYGVYAIDLIPVFLILGTMFWTASEIVGVPTMFAYPGMIAPAHLRGRYFGAMQGTYGLGTAIGPILGVALFDHVGQRVWIWMAAIAALATVVGMIGIRRPVTVQPGTERAAESAAEPAG
jgi:MFS family permease